MDVTKIYSGPIQKVEISTDGGTTFSDLGAIGNGNAEITFEPKSYELADGQAKQLFGLAKATIEIAETDTTKLTLASSAKDTDQTKIKITGIDNKTYTIGPALAQYSVKRGFGDEPHILTITMQKKVLDEDDFVTVA